MRVAQSENDIYRIFKQSRLEIYSEWWVKVAGKQSRDRLENTPRRVFSGARSYGVAPYGSDLSPIWLNIEAVVEVGRRSIIVFDTDFCQLTS